METSPGPWIGALRHSHERLQEAAGPLDAAQLEQLSYASEWSIAQVLSHLGSQAEIFGLFLAAGLTGQDPPGREEFVPIWEVWNAKSPQAQASDALRADQASSSSSSRWTTSSGHGCACRCSAWTWISPGWPGCA